MKAAMIIAVPCGVFLTLFAWRLSQLLSSDAIAMAIGLAFGVLAGVPSMALIAMASRRDAEDDYRPTIDVYPIRQVDTSSWNAPLLTDAQPMTRQAEIDSLRTALHYLESEVAR